MDEPGYAPLDRRADPTLGSLTRSDPSPDSYRDLLANRNYRLYFSASLGSSLGDWAGLFALQILVNSLVPGTRLALFALGGVMMARLVPGVVFGPVAGVLADRYDRKRLMVFCDVVRGLLFLGIALSDDLVALLALTFIVECLSLAFGAAKEATLPTIVKRGQLQEANQLNLLVVYGPIPLGALLPGVLSAFGSLRIALVVNAVSFLVSAALMSRLRLPQRRALRERAVHGRFLDELRGGLAFIAERPLIRSLITGVAGIFFGAGVVVTLGPVFVSNELNRPSADWSLLATAVGVGVAAGILGVRYATRRLQRAKVFPVSLALTSALAAIIPLLTSFNLALVFGFLMGVAVGFSFVNGYTLLHESTPDEVRGKTFAAFYTVTRVALFAALAIAPFVAGAIPRLTLTAGEGGVSLSGVRAAMFSAGMFGLLAALSAGRGMYRAVREPSTSREFSLPVSEHHSVPTGVFIAFEGIEGSGKSTQVRALVDVLRAEGRDVVVTREPGGPLVSEQIRGVLLDPTSPDMHPRTEALLYAAARSEHLQRVVLPALKGGKVVVCDRFLDSSLAYQGFGRGLGPDDVAEVNRWALDGVLPDAVVLLDLDPEEGLRRVARRSSAGGTGPDRIEAEDLAFHRRVARGYHELARRQPGRFLVVDATATPAAVAEQIRLGLDPVLPLPVPPRVLGDPPQPSVSTTRAPHSS